MSGNSLQIHTKLYKRVHDFDIYEVGQVKKLKSVCVILYYLVTISTLVLSRFVCLIENLRNHRIQEKKKTN